MPSSKVERHSPNPRLRQRNAPARVARVLFEGQEEAQIGLNLAGLLPRSRADWLAHARHFYQNLLAQPAWLATMAEHSYDQARLEAELAQVEQVQTAYEWQQMQMSEAQASTQLRNERSEQLESWMDRFIAVARVALQEQPAWLIELGL